jgi:hypothetical protein
LSVRWRTVSRNDGFEEAAGDVNPSDEGVDAIDAAPAVRSVGI